MLALPLFVRRSLLVALPIAVLALGCSDEDARDSVPRGNAGESSDAAGGAGRAGESAGDAGSAGTSSGGAGDDAGAPSDGGMAGAAGGVDDGLARGPAPVQLGTAGDYVVLAQSAVSNVPTSAITGDLGLSPSAASYITGFSLTKVGSYWTSPQVVGRVYAADNDPPTAINLTTAVADMQGAYTDAADRPTPDFLNLGAGTVGGSTLAPGLYRWTSSVTIPTDITLTGDGNDVWIFQITGDLALSAAQSITLSGGARAKNVFWQVAGSVDLGTTSHAEGIVLSKTAIKLGTGASINGRLLAQTAVELASNTVVEPTG